nr:MAG TPA: putative transcriptional regulator [Caudoviricetes sp.]
MFNVPYRRKTAQNEVMGHMKAQPTAITTIPTTGYIRRIRMAQLLGVHVATLDRWIRQKRIPAPIKLGEKSTAFDAVEINNWLAERRGKVA